MRTPISTAHLVAAILLAACGQKTAPPARETARDTGTAPSDASPRLAAPDAAAARAAWLRTIDEYIARPATIPRLRDADGAKRLEQLLSDRAWLDIDGETFEREGLTLLTWFPRAKAFSIALVRLGAVDESVLFKLYMDEVTRALLGAGIEMMEARRKVEPNQEGREEGLARMQMGLAMNVCALLFELPSASSPVASTATSRLSDPRTYTSHSAASLQLILATIDERLDAKRFRRVRDVVDTAYRERVTSAGAPLRIYEGLTMWSPLDERRVVSKGGGFAVTAGNGALVWRDAPPAKAVEHLEWRDGELLFEVYCFAGVKPEDVVASFRANGATERQGSGPGHWMTQQTTGGGKDAAMRVVAIGSRTCAAGIEAPSGTVTPARFDELLGSLAPAP